MKRRALHRGGKSPHRVWDQDRNEKNADSLRLCFPALVSLHISFVESAEYVA